MISLVQYTEAKMIVAAYEEQIRKANEISAELVKREILASYLRCAKEGGHEYRPSGGKLSGASQVSCIYCGHTIE